MIKFNYFILLLLISASSYLFAKNDKTVLMISLDGFRYDYIDRGLTPCLSEFASQGVRAMYLEPSFPSSTFPNHLSIVTGLYPDNHGIIANSFVDYQSGKSFSPKDTSANRDDFWFPKEAFWQTCKKNGIISASYFWVGSELNNPKRRPDLYQHYYHKRDYIERVNGILKWLDLPTDQRPKFITLYFDAADTYGHKYGTESPQLNNSLKLLDSVLNQLFVGLKKRNLYDNIDIIILSDHGMTNLSKDKIIELDNIIPDQYANITNHIAYSLIQPKDGYENKVKTILSQYQNHYTFFDRDSIPERYHFGKNKRISKIFMLADKGWAISYKQKWDNSILATHGYDNKLKDMQGFFIAKGPDFKKNYICNGIANIDIYPLLARIFGINIDHNIDGKLDRIIHLLNNE